VVNAVVILTVALLLIWFGLRPAMNALLPRLEAKAEEKEATVALADATAEAATALPGVSQTALPAGEGAGAMQHLIEDMNARMRNSPLKVLEQLVEMDEEQAASILRQWMGEEEAA
jgi:flagellar M-ring protein FliF